VGRFSFNVKGGRCESCEGDGVITYEMHFLPDVYIACDVCKGSRYNRETLEIRFKDKNINDVLNMTVDEGCDFFINIPAVRTKLLTLKKVGLGYIKIGQQATVIFKTSLIFLSLNLISKVSRLYLLPLQTSQAI
jgi:excinuclease ABC subunit A